MTEATETTLRVPARVAAGGAALLALGLVLGHVGPPSPAALALPPATSPSASPTGAGSSDEGATTQPAAARRTTAPAGDQFVTPVGSTPLPPAAGTPLPPAGGRGLSAPTLEEAAKLLVLDACAAGLLGVGAPALAFGLVTGLAGVPLPVPDLPPLGSLIAQVCAPIGLPGSQSVCPGDDIAGDLVPPSQGRVIDLAGGLGDAAGNDAGDTLREGLGCEIFDYP